MKSALALALLLAAGTAAADIKVLVAVDPSDRESMAIGVLDIGASLSRAAGVPARMSKSQDLSDAMRSTRTGEFMPAAISSAVGGGAPISKGFTVWIAITSDSRSRSAVEKVSGNCLIGA